jgi:hypothetical protein
MDCTHPARSQVSRTTARHRAGRVSLYFRDLIGIVPTMHRGHDGDRRVSREFRFDIGLSGRSDRAFIDASRPGRHGIFPRQRSAFACEGRSAAPDAGRGSIAADRRQAGRALIDFRAGREQAATTSAPAASFRQGDDGCAQRTTSKDWWPATWPAGRSRAIRCGIAPWRAVEKQPASPQLRARSLFPRR